MSSTAFYGAFVYTLELLKDTFGIEKCCPSFSSVLITEVRFNELLNMRRSFGVLKRGVLLTEVCVKGGS
jgi:hypothetical protein